MARHRAAAARRGAVSRQHAAALAAIDLQQAYGTGAVDRSQPKRACGDAESEEPPARAPCGTAYRPDRDSAPAPDNVSPNSFERSCRSEFIRTQYEIEQSVRMNSHQQNRKPPL